MEKIEIFTLATGHSCTTLWVTNLLEMVLSLTVSMIFSIFYFPLKSKMATKMADKVAKIEIFPHSQELFLMFYFPLKSQMAIQSAENLNLFPLNSILLYYPEGQNSLISLHLLRFGDIQAFLFSAKIQDGQQKW